MVDDKLVGWKRCNLKYEDNKLLIAGAFAGYYGPILATIDCTCVKIDCWCGFSSHTTKIGASRYQTFRSPIVRVFVYGNLRFGGGRK